MARDSKHEARIHIGVVGAGTMGQGIVQLFAQAGHRLSVFDAFDGAVPRAISNVTALIQYLALLLAGRPSRLRSGH